MQRKDVEQIFQILDERYERPTEWYGDPFSVLIGNVISQRLRDKNIGVAINSVFSRAKTLEEMNNLSIRELREILRPFGLYNTKSRAIKRICQALTEKHERKVPDTREELLKLPGVGCKTADCVLNYAFGKGVIVVDGNVLRVANRLGLSDSADPKKVRGDLTLFVPEKLRSDINYLLVRLGQEICIPRSPKCSACPITQYCEYGQ